jgi:hypothetical protein
MTSAVDLASTWRWSGIRLPVTFQIREGEVELIL